jgi:hypothetical protein
MDASIELEQDSATESLADSDERLEKSDPNVPAEPSVRDFERGEGRVRSPIEEASFVVLESGKIRFFVRPRLEVEVPRSLDDVQCFSFTLTPRNRETFRRISIKERLPDPHVRERQMARVDGMGSVANAIEIASGTYAIASHRDHTHFLYELELDGGVPVAGLLRQLRIASRTSYVAAMATLRPMWRIRDRAGAAATSKSHDGAVDLGRFDLRRLTPLDPACLDHEGTEFVLVGGGQSRSEPSTPWRRS